MTKDLLIQPADTTRPQLLTLNGEEIHRFAVGEQQAIIAIEAGVSSILELSYIDVPVWGIVAGQEVDVSLPLGPTFQASPL